MANGPLTFDPDFKGPMSAQRRCRDVFFLILFMLFWAGMFIICWQAVSVGNPYQLLFPSNSYGELCGWDNSKSNPSQRDFTSQPYLYFVNPFDSSAAQVCVSQCPENTISPASKSTTICQNNTTPQSTNEFNQLATAQQCAAFVYASSPILYRCLPTNITQIISSLPTGSLKDAFANVVGAQSLAQQIVSDFMRTWMWFLVFAGVAAVVSFVWIVILQFAAGLFVWSVVTLSLAVLNGAVVFFYFTWENARQQSAVFGSDVPPQLQRQEQTFMGFFIAACVVAGVMDLIILALRKRIKIAVQVVKEASRAVRAMPMLTLFPIFIFMLMLVLLAYWVIIELFLASPTEDPTIAGKTYSSSILSYLQWYHLFGLLWTQQFLSGINQCSIAGAVSNWYWLMDKGQLPKAAIFRSFWRVIRYHLGSIAFGALVVAIAQMIQAVLMYIQRQFRAKENKVVKAILACLQCCFACVEKFLKFLNKNAYIEIAIYGKPFCTSAKNAFQLLTRNAFRLVAIDGVSSFILFLSKFTVCAACGCGSYYLMRWYYAGNPLQYIAASVFVIMVISFVVTSLFMYVYDMTIDTIFLCFCEDCERNDGSAERPYYMSNSLQKLTSSRNQGRNKVSDSPTQMSQKVIETRHAFLEEL